MRYRKDAGFPFPIVGGVSRGFTEALMDLEIGESVLMPIPMHSVGGVCKNVRKKTGEDRKFISRKSGAARRVWRTQ